MPRMVRLTAVLFVFSFFAVLNVNAQAPVSDETELNAAISGSEQDLLITTADFTLTGPVNISNYADLYMHAASTPTNFTGSSSGTVFSIQNSTVGFQNIGFKNMSGDVFINSDNSVLSFENAAFENNSYISTDSGFLFTNGSAVNFTGATDFSGNSGPGYGGAFYATGSELTFDGKTAFTQNEAYSGGAFFTMLDFNTFTGANITFNAAVEFTSNTASAASGGALVAMAGAVNFNDFASFKYNRAATDGGAGLISGSDIVFSSAAVFEENKAGGNGGALYITQGFASTADFTGKARFNANEAVGNGGALYVYASPVNFKNAVFTNNKAGGSGGAIYAAGDDLYGDYAQLNINTVNNGAADNKTVFQGNTAAGQPNALYLGALSTASFITASGASVEMYDGIKSDTDTAFMVVSGAGDFNLYAGAELYNLDLSAGNFNLKSSNILTVTNLNADQSSVINMKNASHSNALNVTNFNFDGTLKLDGGSGEGTDGDKVIAANANLGSNSKLDIQTDSAVDSLMNYRKRIYKVLNYQVLTGSFSLVTANEGLSLASLSVNFATAVSYGSDWLTVTLEGLNQSTDFSSIAGLSYNEKQTAKTFDKLSAQTLSPDLDQQISDIDAMTNDELKKDALSDVSGYFLANVIRSAAMGNDKQDIYNRIRYHDMDAHNLQGVWAQAVVQNSEISDDENSRNAYKDFETGVLAGWDILLDDSGTVFGAYGKYNKQDIKQDVKNEATIEETGLGVYAGVLKDEWEIKALLCGSYDSFNTTRYIEFAGRKAEADFSGLTIGVDFEGAIRTYVTESILLRPFAGLEIKNTSYDSFNEKNAGDLSLKVDGGNYSRSTARIGLGLGSDDGGIIEWYANVEGKYLLTEDAPEIDAAFSTTSDKFGSKGAKEGSTILGFGAGGAYRVSNNFKVFADARYQYAEGYQNIYGNLGVRYMFMGSGK